MSLSRRMRRRTLGITALVAALVALATFTAAGSAGSAVGKPPANVSGTFQEWNWDLAVDDPGEHAILPLWIKMVEKKWPHVKLINAPTGACWALKLMFPGKVGTKMSLLIVKVNVYL